MTRGISRRGLLAGVLGVPLARALDVCADFDPKHPPGMEGFDPPQLRTAAGLSHQVYTIGKGPAVFVCHELPGLYKADIELARRIALAGFTAYVPLFFGKWGDCRPTRFLFALGLNPASEFSLWLPRTPAVAHWLLPQFEWAHNQSGGKGVAVIGMCLTGSIGLATMASPFLKAAVLSQPTNPFLFPSELDLSGHDRKIAAESKVDVLALKFSNDAKSPDTRWKTMRQLLKDRLTELIVDSGDHNMSKVPHDAHSLLGGSYSETQGSPTQEAFERVLRFIDNRISAQPTRPAFPQPGEALPGGFVRPPAE